MSWNPALHPRVSAGNTGGGQFAAGGSKGAPGKPAKPATAKGRTPAGPGKNGRYTKKQFGELRSVLQQHQRGANLTRAQAHAEHVAHELHLEHERAVGARKSAPRKTSGKPAARKTAPPKVSAAQRAALAASVASMGK